MATASRFGSTATPLPQSQTSDRSRRPPPPSRSASERAADGALLRSPIQGTVVRVTAAAGDTVTRGQIVCVIEAMKMENDVAAHRDGVLTSLSVTPGMAVRVGDPIAEIG